jgi:hypothetical protein
LDSEVVELAGIEPASDPISTRLVAGLRESGVNFPISKNKPWQPMAICSALQKSRAYCIIL